MLGIKNDKMCTTSNFRLHLSRFKPEQDSYFECIIASLPTENRLIVAFGQLLI